MGRIANGRLTELGNVTDVTAADGEPPVLVETSVEGMLGGNLLHDGPLADHVPDDETVQFVLRNRSDGLMHGMSHPQKTLGPIGDYQALAAVTDAAIHFAIGDPDGDHDITVELRDVAEVSVEGALVAGRLQLIIDNDYYYEFRCRGELRPVASYVADASAAWKQADELAEEARDALDEAEAANADGRHDAALASVEEATAAVAAARDRLTWLGEGARERFEADIPDLLARARRVPRRIIAEAARSDHARARRAWAAQEYETANDAYEDAVAAYERAIGSAGADPSDAALRVRLDDADTERAALTAAPVKDARAAADQARNSVDPAAAAARWRRTLRRLETALYVDWGVEEERFRGNRERLRSALLAAAEELADASRTAAEDCRDAARTHQEAGASEAAEWAYDVAIAHLERARAAVEDVMPARAETLADFVEDLAFEREGVRADGDATSFGRSATD